MCRFLLQGFVFILAFCATDLALCAAMSSSSSAGSASARSLSADVLEQEYTGENASVRSSGGLWIAVRSEATNQLESFWLPERVMLFLARYNTRLGVIWKCCHEVQTDGNKRPIHCDTLPLSDASGTHCSRRTAELFCQIIEYGQLVERVRKIPDRTDLQEVEDLFAFVYQECESAHDCPLVNLVLTQILKQYTSVFQAIFQPCYLKNPDEYTLHTLCFMVDTARKSSLDLINKQIMGDSSKLWPGFQHVLGRRQNSFFLKSYLPFALLREQSLIFENTKLTGKWTHCFSPKGTWLIFKKTNGCFFVLCSSPKMSIDLPVIKDRVNIGNPFGGIDISSDERWLGWVTRRDNQDYFYLLDLSKTINPNDAYICTFGRDLAIDSFEIGNDEEVMFKLSNARAVQEHFYYSIQDLILQRGVHDFSSLKNARTATNSCSKEKVIWWKQGSIFESPWHDPKPSELAHELPFGGVFCPAPETVHLHKFAQYLTKSSLNEALPIRNIHIADTACSTNGKVAIWSTNGDLKVYELSQDLGSLTLRQLLILQASLPLAHEIVDQQGEKFYLERKQAFFEEVHFFLNSLPQNRPMFSGKVGASIFDICSIYFAYPQKVQDSYGKRLVQEHEKRLETLSSMRRRPQIEMCRTLPVPLPEKNLFQRHWARITAYAIAGAVALYGCYRFGKYLNRRWVAKVAKIRI